MRKIFSIAAIILLASGYAAGADYWHFGVGTKFEGVMTGKDYNSALGGGILLTFGNPDSKFTTQFDLDKWGVNYDKSGDSIRTNSLASTDPPTYKIRQRRYSGVGLSLLERYQAFDFNAKYSGYIIAGFGRYFLHYQQEESDFAGVVSMKSKGMQSLGQIVTGVGFEGHLNEHFLGFTEGRFIGMLNAQKGAKILLKAFLGVRYIF